MLAGLGVCTHLRRAGFYPRGGGILEASIEPCPNLKGLDLETLERHPTVTVRSMVSGLPANIADRQAARPANCWKR